MRQVCCSRKLHPRSACQNFMQIAGCKTLAEGFGSVENKRMLTVQKQIADDAANLQKFRLGDA